jgi:uridine kinase
MIILITGASHSGKTMLAQKLLEKYKYPYLRFAVLQFQNYKIAKPQTANCE